MLRSAVALMPVTTVLVSFAGVGSVIVGFETVAVFVMSIVAVLTTLPVTTKVRLLFAGNRLMSALTLLPVFKAVDGQIAPPVAWPQVTATLLILLETISLSAVPEAALGPSLLTTMV